MKLSLFVVLIAVIGVLVFFQWKGCKADSKAVADIQHWKAYGDSAASAGHLYAAKLDSADVSHKIEKVKWSLDSARMASDFNQKNDAVNQEKTKVGGIVAVYQEAKAKQDTVGQLVACDSLATELKKAKVAVTDLQTSATTVVNAYGNEIAQRDSLIDAIVGIGQGLKRANDSLAQSNNTLSRIGIKLAARAAKRFSIGPSVGVAYVGGKVQPVGGITITLSLIHL